MADALAEMTKRERSAYFRQIEEDVGTHAAAILELKDDIGAFQPKDMGELARFHQHVEQQVACLTDETQVFVRSRTTGARQVRGLPFQEAGDADNGRSALLQAGRRRRHAQRLEAARRRPLLAAARQGRSLLQQD